ncbi:hypothetical protein LTR27_003543 [Elasticomyces elasticus]|nr:hypothetical protein LTR27_003543 [Elasticomyces elasticus]
MASKRAAELSRTQPGGSRAVSPATGRSETSSTLSQLTTRWTMSDSSSTPDSKASSPQDTPRAQIDFQFLNFSHPSDAKASNARKAVRSHVTKQQHQKEQKLQQERRTKSFQGVGSESDQRPPPRRPHAETFPPNRPTVIDLPVQSSAGGSSASSPDAVSASPSDSPSASPTHQPQRRIDPAELYPEAWHPYIPRIMDSYLSNMALEVHDLEPAEVRELLRARFFPFITTDAAPYHAVMLVATSHYGRSRGAQAHMIDPLQLRGMAIREINRALEDSVRATSDHLIAAVAHLAYFEALCGNRDAFNTHMTGLLRIVSMRGGLPMLGLNGLLERLLLWIDANATHLLGTRLYFDKSAFPTTAVHPRPNARRFAGEVV